jgi:hypothetical protein
MKSSTALHRHALFAIVAACVLAGDASANVNAPGLAFHGAYPWDEACLHRSSASFGSVRNVCSTNVMVVAWLPVTTPGWYSTSVYAHGAGATWCASYTLDWLNGNVMHMGEMTWHSPGPMAWQSLDTGDRYVWSNTPLMFRCLIEPDGHLGAFHANPL